jgi:hypothetical protein
LRDDGGQRGGQRGVLAIMRDDEKNMRSNCCEQAVGFCFGTVNEDAELSFARL